MPLKNIVSKIVSFILLVFFTPILFSVAIIIVLSDGFPIFFKQKRIGVNNIEFLIFKFRTMKKDTPDVPTHLLKNKEGLYIKSGLFLRKYSFDELPQLFNIILGDMVFIGPRPALYNQKDLIEKRTKLNIHKLYPGVTGWAQINGRDMLTIEEKVEMDFYYKIKQSLSLDIKIIWLSVLKVLKSENVK